MLYGIDDGDDWKTEVALIKANPNYGVSIDIENLKKAQQKAINSSAHHQNIFKTKRLNVWCNARGAYYKIDEWQNCGLENLDINDFIGDDCWVALDLAKVRDLSAKVLLFRREKAGVMHYYLFCRFYMPSAGVYITPETEALGVMYQNWVDQGFLTLNDGTETDYRMIADEVINDSERFKVLEVPHDPHSAIAISHEFDALGLNPVALSQTGKTYTAPIEELEAALGAGRVHHDGNPIMAWCLANTKVRQFSDGNKTIVKDDAASKIDGMAALLMGLSRCMVPAQEKTISAEYW
jgi:phage terminase large subunit-like protein